MELKTFSHDDKIKMIEKIKMITDKKILVKLFSIIYQEIKSVTHNDNGFFIFFHKLSNETYQQVDDELNSIFKKPTSEFDDSQSDKKTYTPYTIDEFPSQNGISPKLKFSNKEKNIIKRRRYDKNINVDTNKNVFYTNFDVSTPTDSDKE